MNSAEHPRRPQQSADGGARRDPDSSESAPDTDDALTDVLRAMRDAVEEHREPSRKRASVRRESHAPGADSEAASR
jgi:hypothetical protein